MAEVAEIARRTLPSDQVLVVDAMTGQDAVRSAKAFHERLALSGVILTKLDGDARGGAALAVKAVTGVPIKFVGTGETVDRASVGGIDFRLRIVPMQQAEDQLVQVIP